MAMQTLKDLFVGKLKDVYDAERRITKALPKVIKAARHDDLSRMLEEHLQQTEGHIDRLDRVFEAISESPGRKPCHGMMGILEEGDELMEKEAPDPVMDAGLIAAAQSMEHYEITAYGCLKTWASQLGMKDEADLLDETLEEEKEADEKLSRIASTVNPEAARAEGMEGEEERGEPVPVRRRGTGGGSASRSSRARRP
jgi:ferritin-like metal-binding protein YciE